MVDIFYSLSPCSLLPPLTLALVAGSCFFRRQTLIALYASAAFRLTCCTMSYWTGFGAGLAQVLRIGGQYVYRVRSIGVWFVPSKEKTVSVCPDTRRTWAALDGGYSDIRRADTRRKKGSQNSLSHPAALCHGRGIRIFFFGGGGAKDFVVTKGSPPILLPPSHPIFRRSMSPRTVDRH